MQKELTLPQLFKRVMSGVILIYGLLALIAIAIEWMVKV